MADHETLARDARCALRRAVASHPTSDGARSALDSALLHVECGRRWRAALSNVNRAVALCRDLADRPQLRADLDAALVALRALTAEVDEGLDELAAVAGEVEAMTSLERQLHAGTIQITGVAATTSIATRDGTTVFVSAWDHGAVDLAIRPPSGPQGAATVSMTVEVAAELARLLHRLPELPCVRPLDVVPERIAFDWPWLTVSEPRAGRSARVQVTPTLLRRIAKALTTAAHVEARG